MSRNADELKNAIEEIKVLRKDFYANVLVPGSSDSFNEPLAKAIRVSDFLELGELFAKDALERRESCGGHFREEYQTKENEAERNDADFKYVAAWGYNKNGKPELFKEDLKYHNVKLKTRSYK
jgi:succinate dehydrogenase / fumarate reductase flavoprotein subunit